MKTDFKITMPIRKSDRDGGWYVTGVAAGTEVDSEGWRLTERCIGRMVDQAQGGSVYARDWHENNSIMSDMGTVQKAWVTPSFELGVEVELDQDHPKSQWLWKQLGKGKQFGMSVMGDVPDTGYSIEKSNGERVVVIDDVEWEEVSFTTKPIYTPSFGTVLRKAIDEAEAKSVSTGDSTSMDVTPVTTDEQTTETPAEVAAAPAEAQEQTVTTVEKAVSTETARDAKGLAKLVKQYHEMGTLLVDLGIDVNEPATAEEAPSTDTTVVEKSVDEASSELLTLVKSLVEANAGMKAELESLKERIPETQVPGVAIRKSEAEEAIETWNTLRRDNPKEALRLALAATPRAATR
jgi:hypothetical protein